MMRQTWKFRIGFALPFLAQIIKPIALIARVMTMATGTYEPLKCGVCRRKIGYMRIDVKLYPPKTLIKLTVGGPMINVKKDVYCSKCFEQVQKQK